MSTARTTRTAVIGCGYWGKNLVRNFANLSDLRICCDSNEAIRRRIALEYPHVRVTASFAEVLDSAEVDAVILATPASQHAEMTLAVLAAGKHVFVEKPLALNLADAERVAAAAEHSDRILMVGHLMQYHPGIEYMKHLIDSGELGEIYYSYSQRVNLGKVRSDENALWSLAPHDVSMILYLMDEEPDAVEATGQAFLQAGIEDVAFLTLRFGSGRVSHIHVSWLDPHKERRLTIVGSRKMAVFDDMRPQEMVRIFDKGVARRDNAADYESYGELLSLREGDILIPRLVSKEPLALECAAFLHSVATGARPRTDARGGLAVVRVLEAAQQAMERHSILYGGSLR